MKRGYRRSLKGYAGLDGEFSAVNGHGLTRVLHPQNKELEASEERKRKAKQLEMQRKEALRTGRPNAPKPPSYPVYSPPSRPSVPDSYDSYEAEKKKSFAKYVLPECSFYVGCG